MSRGLPLREFVFLQKWYEDYMAAKYGTPPPKDDEPTEDEIIGDAPWGAEVITGGKT